MVSSAWYHSLELWNDMSWKERGIATLSILAVLSSVVATRALVRHQDTVKHVLFQLSFAICGPVIWFLTSRLPHHYGLMVVFAAMSLVPSLASFFAVLRAQWEKEAPSKQAESDPARSAWFATLDSIDAPMKDAVSEDLQAKMRMWLSYWALWPFFHVGYTLANSLDRIGEEDRPTIDGLFVAIILWTQFWEASRVAPYGFALCAVCLQGASQKASRAADIATNHATTHAVSMFATLSERIGTQSPVIYVALGFAVIVTVSVLLGIIQLTEALVTIVLLFCVAFDSARCVARNSVEVYTSRLAFWVLAMAWLQFRTLPILGAAVTVWTPFVLVAAMAAGETILHGIVFLAMSIRTRCCSPSSEKMPASDTRDAKYQEVSSRENLEEGQTLNRASLNLPGAERGSGL